VTHVITEACIASRNQSCVEVCPVDCIYDVDRMLVIHPVECIDCGACIPECPVEAIFRDEDLPGEQARFLAINAAIVDGREAVAAALTGIG
jgi:NAD-dependent dihydropyrimidine dehydrogenase PreA subunit